MFSGIIEDLTKNVEGASLTEKLLTTPLQKFNVTFKDVVYSVTQKFTLGCYIDHR